MGVNNYIHNTYWSLHLVREGWGIGDLNTPQNQISFLENKSKNFTPSHIQLSSMLSTDHTVEIIWQGIDRNTYSEISKDGRGDGGHHTKKNMNNSFKPKRKPSRS